MNTQSFSLKKGTKLHSGERVYEIMKVLGAGAFGITYLAVTDVAFGNITTKVKFAVKEHFMSASCYRGEDGASVNSVPTAKPDVEASLADFITEAKRLKELCRRAKGIVSVNETFEANNTAYYVMEFLDGGSPGRCTEEQAVDIVLQVADALGAVHAERVLHLDVKPDNIVMKTDDLGATYPVLIDFGISKHFDSDNRPTSSLKAKGASSGYAPQEQYGGVTEFSPKFDIYALGAVLYFLCTGKNPPDAFKISPGQQELRRELEGLVSPRVMNAILKAMAPNALERTPTIEQFRRDLAAAPKPKPQAPSPIKTEKIKAKSSDKSLPTAPISNGKKHQPAPSAPDTEALRRKGKSSSGKKLLIPLLSIAVAALFFWLLLPVVSSTDDEPSTQQTASKTVPQREADTPTDAATPISEIANTDITEDSSTEEATDISAAEPSAPTETPAATTPAPSTAKEKEDKTPTIEDKKEEKPQASTQDINYAAMAEQCLNNKDYDNAHRYALLAAKSGKGLDQARKVVKVLSVYGYYHGGEHGGEPKF